MDAAITNIGSSAVYIPGPEIEILPGETKNWNNITIADLDGNTVIKDGVLAGNLSVSVSPDAHDAVAAVQGSMSPAGLELYTYANLPTGYEGRVAFCTDGLKVGEVPAAGTGVPVYFSVGFWRVYSTDLAVAI